MKAKITTQERKPPTAAQVKASEELRAQRRANADRRHERVGKNLCPECEAPAPKHDKNRAELVQCECGHRYHTYPGL